MRLVHFAATCALIAAVSGCVGEPAGTGPGTTPIADDATVTINLEEGEKLRQSQLPPPCRGMAIAGDPDKPLVLSGAKCQRLEERTRVESKELMRRVTERAEREAHRKAEEYIRRQQSK